MWKPASFVPLPLSDFQPVVCGPQEAAAESLGLLARFYTMMRFKDKKQSSFSFLVFSCLFLSFLFLSFGKLSLCDNMDQLPLLLQLSDLTSVLAQAFLGP